MIDGACWEQGYVYVKALDPVTWGIIINVALSVAAALLLGRGQKAPKNPLDDSKSEPSVRGTLASNLLGRLRIGPVIGYVGDRVITKEDSGAGGGGKGGGGDKPQTTIYNEMGMHIISTGPGIRIKGIYQAGKQILDGEISSDTTQSGATVSLGSEGSFRVYWGTADQSPGGVDEGLAEQTGLNSSFPHIFYIVWDRKRLGQQAIWPQIEYDVEVGHPADMPIPTGGKYLRGSEGTTSLSHSIVQDPNTLSTAGYTSTLASSVSTDFAIKTTDSDVDRLAVGSSVEQNALSYSAEVVNVFSNGADYIVMFNRRFLTEAVGNTYDFSYAGVAYSGVNPASALYQLLFMGFPHGIGLSPALFNLSDFDDLANLFKNTELSPCTVLLRSGKSYKDGMASIMQDFGLMFWVDTATGKHRFSAARAGETPIAIGKDAFMSNELARVFGYAVLDPDKLVYTFKDIARKFADSSILITNDAGAKYSENPNTKKVSLNTITDFTTASMVSSRREQEGSLNEVLTISLSPAYVDMEIGQTATLEGLSGTYRLLDKRPDPNGASFAASFALDAYSITNNYNIIQGSGANPVARIDPSPDLFIGLIEANRFLAKDQNGFFASRIRYNNYIINSDIYTSADDVSYSFLDAFFYGTGGTLTAELGTTTTLKETGVFIDIAGPDITDVQDLTASEALWRGGAQLAVIGTEICFLEGIVVETGELIGLIRARYGTRMQIHPVDTPVFILSEDTLELLTRSFIAPEAILYIKSLPFTSTAQLPSTEAVAESITYKGGGFRPLPCENLFTDDGTNAYATGEDIDLRWSYKNASDVGASGIGLSGEASATVPPEGTFLLQILDGSTVVRTIEQAGTTYSYSNVNLVTDFSGEPASFNVRVFEVLNGLLSEEETATVEKV